MAKSLRSKTKRAFRRIKREDPKSDYAIRDKIRVARLSEKLKAIKDVSDSEEELNEAEGDEVDDAEMQVADGAPEASTSKATSTSTAEKGESSHAAATAAETHFCWLLGLLDQDALTFAESSSHPPSYSASFLRFLNDLSIKAGY